MTADATEMYNMSDIVINLKQYENCDERKCLKRPSDDFFKLCRLHIAIFTKNFIAKPHLNNIKTAIVTEIINITNHHYPGWFAVEHSCYHHRLQTVNLLIIILLWKNCKWSLDKNKTPIY